MKNALLREKSTAHVLFAIAMLIPAILRADPLSSVDESNQVQKVSMISLISSPEKFDNKTIRVGGYIRISFEENILFFSRESMAAKDSSNGVWISYGDGIGSQDDLIKYKNFFKSIKKYSGQHVYLEGVFDMKDSGHLGCCAGTISRITLIETLKGERQVFLSPE